MASCSAALDLDNSGSFLCDNYENFVSSAVNPPSKAGTCVYDRQFLLGLRTLNTFQAVNLDTLERLRSSGLLRPAAEVAAGLPAFTDRRRERRRRGCRAGLKAKLRANPFQTLLPSVILANVQSLENKLDHLKLVVTTRREVRDCCVLILTESWLNSAVPDAAISLQGLTTFRLDGSAARGGGTVLYINEKWSDNSVVVCSQCSPHIELLAVKSRPFFLAREHSIVVIMAVFIPPSANTEEALSVLYQTITQLQTTHPEGIFIVAGDFNQADMKTVLPHFHQHVDLAARGCDTPYFVYTNIRNAYKAAPRPHFSFSDHVSVMLTPGYRPPLTRGNPAGRPVRV